MEPRFYPKMTPSTLRSLGSEGPVQMGEWPHVLQKKQEGLRAQSQTLSCPGCPVPQPQISEALDQRRQNETITHFHIKGLMLPGFQTSQLRTF